MSKKLCFDKNTFFIGIIIIIFILLILSYFINIQYNNNNDAKIHNLINKKILNIKDKIINNKRNTNNNYNYTNDKVLEEDVIANQLEEDVIANQLEEDEKKCEHIALENVYERIYERIVPKEQELIQTHIELVKKKALSDINEYEYEVPEQKTLEQELIQNHIELVNKKGLSDIKEYEYKVPEHNTLEQHVVHEQDININTKVNFKNNINDRMNDRESHEIIKYKINDEVQQRDLNVLLNPIYPPLARVERPIFDNLIRMNFGQATRGSEDTFRLMAYLINTNKNDVDMGNNIWKLFGRQTYKGSNIGEFYVSPVNDHTSDMKIYLKNEMMPKDKIRDIYALPTEVYLESPFFSKNAYTINELPKSDFNSNYL